jgi:hypothetical protein
LNLKGISKKRIKEKGQRRKGKGRIEETGKRVEWKIS